MYCVWFKEHKVNLYYEEADMDGLPMRIVLEKLDVFLRDRDFPAMDSTWILCMTDVKVKFTFINLPHLKYVLVHKHHMSKEEAR